MKKHGYIVLFIMGVFLYSQNGLTETEILLTGMDDYDLDCNTGDDPLDYTWNSLS